jgi:hypothetical protein
LFCPFSNGNNDVTYKNAKNAIFYKSLYLNILARRQVRKSSLVIISMQRCFLQWLLVLTLASVTLRLNVSSDSQHYKFNLNLEAKAKVMCHPKYAPALLSDALPLFVTGLWLFAGVAAVRKSRRGPRG